MMDAEAKSTIQEQRTTERKQNEILLLNVTAKCFELLFYSGILYYNSISSAIKIRCGTVSSVGRLS